MDLWMTFGIAYFCWIIFFTLASSWHENEKYYGWDSSHFSFLLFFLFLLLQWLPCTLFWLFYTCLDRGSAFLWHLINTYPVLSHVRCWGHSENPVFHVSASSFLHMSFHHLSTPPPADARSWLRGAKKKPALWLSSDLKGSVRCWVSTDLGKIARGLKVFLIIQAFPYLKAWIWPGNLAGGSISWTMQVKIQGALRQLYAASPSQASSSTRETPSS